MPNVQAHPHLRTAGAQPAKAGCVTDAARVCVRVGVGWSVNWKN